MRLTAIKRNHPNHKQIATTTTILVNPSVGLATNVELNQQHPPAPHVAWLVMNVSTCGVVMSVDRGTLVISLDAVVDVLRRRDPHNVLCPTPDGSVVVVRQIQCGD